ncbi:proto-oncogene tyrosine-protein kinase ROS-like [Antedon mediterranea]|uniref:proto-oncogene tyrosine-protein kinase ROS-like n=1 Tax=Antedon mediterranea TaxID=105859 RepID=UPI003AF783CB
MGVKTSVSIPLDWDGADHEAVSYRIQWRYADVGQVMWHNFDVEAITITKIEVTGLDPYVNYRFRVVWIITAINYLNSTESSMIQTEADGVPASPPTIVSLTSLSYSSIDIAWQLPFFSNGPITMYTLTVVPTDGSTDVITAEISPDQLQHTFRNLADSVKYTVTVAARNSVGLGPIASDEVTTLTMPTYGDIPAYLIVGVNNFYLPSGDYKNALTYIDFMSLQSFESAESVHQIEIDQAALNGCAFYFNEQVYFFSDDTGAIHRRAENDSQSTIIYNSPNHPKEMSVDWLNEMLYFIEDQQISRCDLDGGNVEVAVGNLVSTPTEIRVDPANGYLFWSELNSGIYRLQLSSVVTSPDNKELIVANSQIQAFYVSSANMLIYYPDESNGTIYSTNLDGTLKTLINNVRNSRITLQNVTSLVQYGDTIVWVESLRMYTFVGNENSHEVTAFGDAVLDKPGYRGMVVDHPSAQPYPIPLRPEGVQALFTNDTATVSWDALTVTGSWQGWSYRVQAFNGDTVVSSTEVTSSNDEAVLESLSPSTTYDIKVVGFTADGDGPVSMPYTGETLQTAIPEPYLVIGNDQGIQRVGLDGNEQQPITSSPSDIKDIDWYGDLVIWIHSGSSNDEVYWTSTVNSGPTTQINGISIANEIAIDWMGGQIYWADNEQIKRAQWSTSNSSNVVPEVVIEAVVVDMAIDSPNAYIYWISRTLFRPYAVECARLNNELGSRVVIYETEELVDEQIVSLTLDFDGGFVYWLVDTGSLRLYKTALAVNGIEPNPTFVIDVQEAIQTPTLHYYSNRFFWITTNKNIAVASGNGNSMATISSVSADALSVVQRSLHPVPDGFSEQSLVIPNAIPSRSITIHGSNAADFNVEWRHSSEVFDSVDLFYDVTIEIENGETIQKTLSVPSYKIQNLAPYTQLDVTVYAYTYYGVAPSSQATLRSPEAAPSSPQNPRVFVSTINDPMSDTVQYKAEFRWEAPLMSNGVLRGYTIYYGVTDSLNSTLNITDISVTTYTASLNENAVYYFQVDAYTDAGNSAKTNLVTANRSVPVAVPMVLVVGASGLAVIDLDTSDQEDTGLSNILALGYISQRNNMLYYVDGSDKSIKQAEEDGSNPTELLEIGDSLDANNVGFAVDWIAQKIYWTEKENTDSVIYGYDLTIGILATKMQVFVETGTITSLAVNPQGKQLFWSVTTDSGNILKTSDLDGGNVRPLIGQSIRRRRQTPCPSTQSLAVFDPTSQSVFFTSGEDIWTSDTTGQTCNLLVDGSSLSSPNGLPADSISIDSSRLYWSNKTDNFLSSVLKADGSDLQTYQYDADLVVAIDNMIQPYPASECLAPLPYNGSISNTDKSSMTLDIDLSPATWTDTCGNIVTAAVVYNIEYSDGGTAINKDSTDTSVELNGLTPYTDYNIRVAVSNYYSSGTPVHGQTVTYKTTEDVPSEVQNPAAVVLSPVELMLTWDEPATLNGDPLDISYYIEYEYTDNENVHQTVLLPDKIQKTNSTSFTFEVIDLLPSKMYNIKILAYPVYAAPRGNLDSEHSEATVNPNPTTMFMQPGILLDLEATNFSIQASWTSPSDGSVQSHEYQYKTTDMDTWSTGEMVESTSSNTLYKITFGNETHPLDTNTEYEVRVKAYYASGSDYDSDTTTITTAAGLPRAPGKPLVDKDEVTWDEADNNGADITQYILQASVDPNGAWNTVYNASEPLWEISGLTDKMSYRFRVAAVTEIGRGPFSGNSDLYTHDVLQPPDPSTGPDDGSLLIIIIVVAIALLLVIVITSVVIVRRKKKKPQQITVTFNSDTELAALRQYPQNLVKKNNQIYAVTNLENGDEVELPIFPRERLSLITFLGSGAFGEVFEGQAVDILGEGKGMTKVAVKTLRDKSTDQEKEDFLKEAVLMGNFKHPNILALLGVCLDNDPQYIILELMEGGDLLNYIRGARGVAGGPAKLTLLNLVDIVIDVAEGCKYLESMHFVHRDIAARNCLVTTKEYDVSNCSVKIGDFGLARDVYKSDYYRKEGEGLLPVRWMAPEALVDGVFTSFSDVWAFAIVMWEVLTLGQQPYPARSNVEVLQFVTEGGRLDSPDNCPEEIYNLMIKCMHKQTMSRPTFRTIVDRLENFRRKSIAISGADHLGFETSAQMKLNYAKIQMDGDQYLNPITSKQSLCPEPPAFSDINLNEPSSPTDSGMGTLKESTPEEASNEEGGGLKKTRNSLRGSLKKMLPSSNSFRKDKQPLPELSRPPPREFDNSKYSRSPRYGPAPVSRSGSKVSAISGMKPNMDDEVYNAELPPPPSFSGQASAAPPSAEGGVRHPNPFLL